jgi:uncharacterized protein YutD
MRGDIMFKVRVRIEGIDFYLVEEYETYEDARQAGKDIFNRLDYVDEWAINSV